MSEQKYKSQADKAAAPKKMKSTKPAPKKDNKKTKVSVNSVPAERKIPLRLISSVLFLGLFILCLVIFFKPEGALVKLLESVFLGLIGVNFIVEFIVTSLISPALCKTITAAKIFSK